MLPSKEIKDLCNKVVVVALKSSDKASTEFGKEFNAPDAGLWLWVVVLDAKGETLASFWGDKTGKACTKENVDKFPSMLVEKIEICMQRKQSVQELERIISKNPTDEAAFGKLADRLEENLTFGKLAKPCDEIASTKDIPTKTWENVEIRGFINKVQDNSQEHSKLIEEGEYLITKAPHKCERIVKDLFYFVYSDNFDVPCKTQAAIERIKCKLKEHENSKELSKRIDQLTTILEE